MLEEQWTQNVNALKLEFSERIRPNEKIVVKNGITHPVVEIDMLVIFCCDDCINS